MQQAEKKTGSSFGPRESGENVPQKNSRFRSLVFFMAAAFCLTPYASPPLALFLGMVVSWTIGNPVQKNSQTFTKVLLQASIVGLGFGIDFHSALRVGGEGFLFTFFSIAVTLFLGFMAGKLLGIDRKTSYLIASGTAICGGSAIAAISPVIGAERSQISVALGTVFILNAVALFLFPEIGTWLHMSQQQFGLWAAIAIHDTSSVVGAATRYGAESLEIATTVKLARTLWIIPVAAVTALFFRGRVRQVKVPWFIGLFVAAMLLYTFLPAFQPLFGSLVPVAKAGLVLTLFLIGTGFSRENMKTVGWQPLVQGLLTWLVISVGSLLVVLSR